MYCRGSSCPRAGEQREEAPRRGHGPLSRGLAMLQVCNEAGPANTGKTGKQDSAAAIGRNYCCSWGKEVLLK